MVLIHVAEDDTSDGPFLHEEVAAKIDPRTAERTQAAPLHENVVHVRASIARAVGPENDAAAHLRSGK